MGTKERQERDREAVRRAILDAARNLFVAEGYGNVSIRKIAERIEYSPAALYSYFPSKDDIFYALATEGFALLGLATASEQGAETLAPLDRLRESLWRLYQFSIDHPQYFALMFLDRTVPRISRDYESFDSARYLRAELLGHITACLRVGSLPMTTKPEAALRLLIVGILGVAALRLSDRVPADEDPDVLARYALDVTIAGLQAGVPFRNQVSPQALDVIASGVATP